MMAGIKAQIQELKEQFIAFLVKAKILKETQSLSSANVTGVESGAGTGSLASSRTGANSSSQVSFAMAWKNFQDDIPHILDHFKNIGSATQDKQIAFGCMCLGVVLILVGVVVQILV